MDILKFLQQQPNLKTVSVPARTLISEEGQACEHLIVLTEGLVKVSKSSADGKSLTLYHILPGESCVLTASALMNQQPFNAEAVTLEDSSGYVIPAQQVLDWQQQYPEWQAFMFNLLGKRMVELLEKVNQLAFDSLDHRLNQWLAEQPVGIEIAITHQQIADELASSREVISRMLKKLEQNNTITLNRGKIKVL